MSQNLSNLYFLARSIFLLTANILIKSDLIANIDACVKSLLRQRVWALKISQTPGDAIKIAFLCPYEHFPLLLSSSKTQNWAQRRPYWPLRIRFHAFLRTLMPVKYSSRQSWDKSHEKLPVGLAPSIGLSRFGVSIRCLFLQCRREFYNVIWKLPLLFLACGRQDACPWLHAQVCIVPWSFQ